MTVEIPAEYQQFVQAVIAQGEYQTEAQVIGEALRLFQERESRLQALRDEIRPALDRLDRGEGIELDGDSLQDFFADIQRRGDKRLEAEQDRK